MFFFAAPPPNLRSYVNLALPDSHKDHKVAKHKSDLGRTHDPWCCLGTKAGVGGSKFRLGKPLTGPKGLTPSIHALAMAWRSVSGGGGVAELERRVGVASSWMLGLNPRPRCPARGSF